MGVIFLNIALVTCGRVGRERIQNKIRKTRENKDQRIDKKKKIL